MKGGKRTKAEFFSEQFAQNDQIKWVAGKEKDRELTEPSVVHWAKCPVMLLLAFYLLSSHSTEASYTLYPFEVYEMRTSYTGVHVIDLPPHFKDTTLKP